MIYKKLFTAVIVALALLVSVPSWSEEASPPNPSEIFAEHCLDCHGRAALSPTTGSLSNMTADEINKELWFGVMQQYANGLDDGERRAVAKWIASQEPEKDTRESGVQMCETSAPLKPDAAHDWPQLSRDILFNRHVDDHSLTADRVEGIKLKWAVSFPVVHAFGSAGNPVSVVGDRLFVGSLNQWVYSLDRETGCAHWTYRADARVRSNVAVSEGVAVFGDLMANVYGVDANSGQLLWRTKVDWTAGSRVTGNVTTHAGVAYVPLSSTQEVLNLSKRYSCCTFRGSVVALDPKTGQEIWKTYTIEQEPKYLGKTKNGRNRYGPSGVPVWSGLTIDEKRKLVYVPTGNQFTEPVVKESDAVIALDMTTGKRRWVKSLAPLQMGGQDIYHLGCESWVDEERSTCSPENPKGQGDRDLGAPVALVKRPGGKDILLAGTKDGMFYGLDPDDDGRILWSSRVGRGGEIGGIEWGFSTDGETAYVPVIDADADYVADGSLTAIDVASGTPKWRVENVVPACEGKTAPPCNNGFTAPTTVVGDFVFAGTNDGLIRIYEAASGKQIWSFDTVREYQGVNGRTGQGGSLGFGGPVISGNNFYQMSGLDIFNIGLPGNVLLAFEIPD